MVGRSVTRFAGFAVGRTDLMILISAFFIMRDYTKPELESSIVANSAGSSEELGSIRAPGRSRKLLDDLLRRQLVDLSMTWNWLRYAGDYVSVNVMSAALPDQNASLLVKNANQVEAFHENSISPTFKRVSARSPSRMASRMSRSMNWSSASV